MASTNLTGPDYYKRGSIQVWDFIRDQDLNFHLGNAIKYICRAGYKGIEGRSASDAYIKDLKKAIHYLQNELENELVSNATGGGVPNDIPCQQLSVAESTPNTTDFDR